MEIANVLMPKITDQGNTTAGEVPNTGANPFLFALLLQSLSGLPLGAERQDPEDLSDDQQAVFQDLFPAGMEAKSGSNGELYRFSFLGAASDQNLAGLSPMAGVAGLKQEQANLTHRGNDVLAFKPEWIAGLKANSSDPKDLDNYIRIVQYLKELSGTIEPESVNFRREPNHSEFIGQRTGNPSLFPPTNPESALSAGKGFLSTAQSQGYTFTAVELQGNNFSAAEKQGNSLSETENQGVKLLKPEGRLGHIPDTDNQRVNSPLAASQGVKSAPALSASFEIMPPEAPEMADLSVNTATPDQVTDKMTSGPFGENGRPDQGVSLQNRYETAELEKSPQPQNSAGGQVREDQIELDPVQLNVGKINNISTAHGISRDQDSSPIDSARIWAQVVDVLKKQELRPPEVKELSIRLNPAELGEVKVSMKVENGQLQLTMTAAEQTTGLMLSNHIQELKNGLTQAGVPFGDLQMGYEQSNERQPEDGSRQGEKQQASYYRQDEEQSTVLAVGPYFLPNQSGKKINLSA